MSTLAGIAMSQPGTSVLASGGKGYDPPGLQSFEWKSLWDFSLFGLHFHITRVLLLLIFGAVVAGVFFYSAFHRAKLVPGKLQGYAEMMYDLVRNSIARDVIGPEGVRFAPYLATVFVFIFLMNLFAILPVAQFPVTSRFAIPLFLALITWVLYNYLGIRRHGFFGYLKMISILPGVPLPMHILLVPLEFLSNLIVRPFTLAVRLFANMFAGHLLILVFTTGGIYLLTVGNFSAVFSPVSFLMAIVMTFFELLVITLQAYVFTVLTAAYVQSSLAEEH